MKNKLKTINYVTVKMIVALLFFCQYSFAKEELTALAERAAERHGVDRHLFNAVIQQESRWNTKAVSPDGAVGLTQLQPNTAKSFCGLEKEDLIDPEKNLFCGAKYLAEQIRRFGSVETGLCAFNAGPSVTARLGRCPNYGITRYYVKAILAYWEARQLAAARSF